MAASSLMQEEIMTTAYLQLGEAGARAALAVKLFETGELAPGRGAKLARMSLPQFLEYVGARGISVVRHDPDELEQELAAFDQRRVGA
jgi:predicted HTH domain antitoxin